MSFQEANEYVAETVSDYILNGFPLTYLTGEERGGKPDNTHVDRLAKAMAVLGFTLAAGYLERKHNKAV